MPGEGEEGSEEEWYEEEESEYEYASYHHGGENGNQEAHLESGVLYQPLETEPSEAEAKTASSLVRLCEGELEKQARPSRGGACAEYAHWYSGIEHWAKKHIIRPIGHFVHSVKKIAGEIIEHLPKCYPNEIEGGGQCSSAPPGGGGNPFYPLFPDT
jgi:hypothetical protein